MDRRNHRKLVVADGARGWMGGRNVGELMRKFKANIFLSQHGDEVCPAQWEKEGDKTLRRLPGYPHFFGNLVLRVLRHVVQPCRPRGIVKAFSMNVFWHCRSSSSVAALRSHIRAIAQGVNNCYEMRMKVLNSA